MFRRTLQCAVFSGAIAVPGLLFAQPPGRGGPQGGMHGGPPTEMILQLFQQADANGDGSVTKAELTTALQSQTQSRGNRFGRMAPPSQDGPNGQFRRPEGPPPNGPPPIDGETILSQDAHQPGRHGPPQPGQIIPEPMIAALTLDVRQQRQLDGLQAIVDKRLASILTADQMEQLKNHRPPHGPGIPNGDAERND
ncbi:EF-hand domain-containing protein [Roseiconus lacunae]|uniref:EF-hand domain-containing protein n=1 Tax=Roseiconus lacunae TaxID=2605694 RepID=UPI00309259C8|nr:EF-hand domain-containing protein [Stieleria sp. HD01]